MKFNANIINGTYPKLSCREENAGTTYGLRRVPHKNICTKTIIHEIPEKKKQQ